MPNEVAVCGEDWSECAAEQMTCKNELGECLADLEAELPAAERFLAGDRDGESETIARPILQRHFDALDDVDYGLECRAGVCRVDLYWPEQANERLSTAQTALQRDEMLRGSFAAVAFHGGQPEVRDLGTGEWLSHQVIYLDGATTESGGEE